MEIGKQIQNIRKENGLSQEQFGQKFHVTRQTVSNWKNEKSIQDRVGSEYFLFNYFFISSPSPQSQFIETPRTFDNISNSASQT